MSPSSAIRITSASLYPVAVQRMRHLLPMITVVGPLGSVMANDAPGAGVCVGVGVGVAELPGVGVTSAVPPPPPHAIEKAATTHNMRRTATLLRAITISPDSIGVSTGLL